MVKPQEQFSEKLWEVVVVMVVVMVAEVVVMVVVVLVVVLLCAYAHESVNQVPVGLGAALSFTRFAPNSWKERRE